jgi:hypothetical protein
MTMPCPAKTSSSVPLLNTLKYMLKCQHEVGEFIEFSEKECNVKPFGEKNFPVKAS